MQDQFAYDLLISIHLIVYHYGQAVLILQRMLQLST